MVRTLPANPCSSNPLVSAAVVVAALYFGRDILLPFALAVLLSFLLAPLVELLEKWKLARIPAVLTVVAFAFFSFVVVAFVAANQLYDFAYRLPSYRENILAKVRTLQGDETGVLARVAKSVDEMRETLSSPPEGEQAADARSPTSVATPVRVEVVESFSGRQIAQRILGPLLSPLGSAAIVIVFLIFMLLKREDLRNRFLQLIGGSRLNVTTQALDDAARRINRYLLMQLIINSSYGLVICIGLVLIGLPNALLWGGLTAVLRFLPYIGPWIAALMPMAISLAVFDTWIQPAFVLALFVVNELVSNNVIEPWLYGSSTGISTIGILTSAVFWTWLWGPLGLVMATPLTVCLTVIGRYVPQLAFFDTMLSDQETLPPPSRLYQRLLALDPEEATEVVEDYFATSSLANLYDSVLLPALALAERDRHQGELDEVKQQFVHQTMREIVEDLGERTEKLRREQDAAPNRAEDSQAPVRQTHDRTPILCLPARDDADEIAGLMMVQMLTERGIAARVVSTNLLSGEMMELVAKEGTALVCVSALPPFAATHATYLCKRLKAKFPQLKVIVGLWQTGNIREKTRARLMATGIDKLETTLVEATLQLERLSQNFNRTDTP